VVYVLHVERVERAALAERHVMAVLAAAGAEIEWQTADEARAVFDEALAAEPEPESDIHRILRELGVA